jgi:6-phospho-beta-glucosidase
MKLTIIGAGSSYTPELFEKLATVREQFPVRTVTLMDTDAKRLEAVASFCARYSKHLCLNLSIESTLDLHKAIYGADFINTQIRVGKNQSRIKDEKIPLSMGVIGQETTGPGGFMKALRTIPAMMQIAQSIKQNAPHAWLINYTNPTGIIAQALHDYTDVKCAALCAGGIRAAWRTASAFNVDWKDVQFDIFGLNHLNYSYNIKVRGRPITPDEFTKIVSRAEVSEELALAIGAVPSGYLQYFYHRNRVIEKLQKAKQTRGEQVLELEKEIFADFLNPDFHEKPPSLKKRGGGGYSEVAIGVMDAIYNNKDTWHVINVPNNGVFKTLPDNAVMETAVLVNANGIKPLAAAPPPKSVWGFVAAVKNYEMLTAQAAVTGDYTTALLALTHHPLVGDYDLAKKMLNQMLLENKEELNAEYFIH